VLTVEAAPAHAENLAGVARSVWDSLRVGEPISPAERIDALAEPIELPQVGLAMRLPAGWSRRVDRRGLLAYQTDYTRGGIDFPRLTVQAYPTVRSEVTAATCNRQALKGVAALWADQGFEVINQGPAHIGGQAGRELLCRMQAAGVSLVCARRSIVRNGQVITLSLTAPVEEPSRLQALLDTIARGVTFSVSSGSSETP
jgi:hypothetical protein